MSTNPAAKKKGEAEKEINRIIAHLERDTGCIVTGIEIIKIDMTSIGDETRQLLCTVDISLEHLPGTQWMVG